MEQILCNILNAFKGCPSFPFLYLAPNVTLSVHTRHTYSHIGYIRHVYQIIFCLFILYGYTWWKNISKRLGLGGDWCTQTTRILLWCPFDKYIDVLRVSLMYVRVVNYYTRMCLFTISSCLLCPFGVIKYNVQ
jgi:hypothetical protein